MTNIDHRAAWERLLDPTFSNAEALPQDLLIWVDGERNTLSRLSREITVSERERRVRAASAGRSRLDELTR